MPHPFHPSEQELLMAMDGELSSKEAAAIEQHLTACWTCRSRRQDLENSISEFIHFHRDSLPGATTPPEGPAALLLAQMRQSAEGKQASGDRFSFFRERFVAASLLLPVLVVVGLGVAWEGYRAAFRQAPPVTVPNPSLTPGATIVLSQPDVCRQASGNNRTVSFAMRRQVFAEYGISNADPGAYEVDYLITPALGGAEDIHNLWPESTHSTRWNAQVKDALEDHLHYLVCEGQVDLQTAQREIAGNWIEAYKKYFHTDEPLPDRH